MTILRLPRQRGGRASNALTRRRVEPLRTVRRGRAWKCAKSANSRKVVAKGVHPVSHTQ